MGIKGIYNEIGPGQRIALAKLAAEHFERHGRPLRMAIDVSIWLFQIQSGKGGTNPALRTFYYRLLRLISLAIQPVFVFDGPNKPPFKRHHRTGPNVSSIPEFLAKQLLKQFGLPIHLAPGEAEAECALLQKRGLVDAVLSEDVDTLAFGSGLTLRNWSPQPSTKTKTPSHVNVYDAARTKAGASGLDSEGMILVALMSGGDYIPEGIPGCGPKTACEAARAGFGASLCKIDRNDRDALEQWKEGLVHELRTNESRFFRQKHRALSIPDEFPRSDILGYYTHPVVSSDDRVERLKSTITWDHDFDIPGLRSFCADAFDWTCISGAKHFARKLAHSLLVKELRLRSNIDPPDDLTEVAQQEAKLVKSIYLRRQHPSTDGLNELRVSFVPLDLVPIDLDAEEPDPEIVNRKFDGDDEAGEEDIEEQVADPTSPRKARGPMQYDPRVMQKAWIPEIFVKAGVPLKAEDWEEAHRDARKYEAMKALRRRNERVHPRKKKPLGGMQPGALNAFTQVSKPISTVASSSVSPALGAKEAESIPCIPLCDPLEQQRVSAAGDLHARLIGQSHAGNKVKPLIESVNLTGIARPTVAEQIGATSKSRTQRAFKAVSVESVDMTGELTVPSSAPERPSSQGRARSTFRLPPEIPATPKKQLSIIDLLSPSSRSSAASAAIVPSKRPLVRSYSDPAGPMGTSAAAPALQALNEAEESGELPSLPPSVNTRRRRHSPLHRSKTISDVPMGGAQDHDGFSLPSPPSKRASLPRPLHADDAMTMAKFLVDPSEDKENNDAVVARPSTPNGGAKRTVETICISSSPTTPAVVDRLKTDDRDFPEPGTPSPVQFARGQHLQESKLSPNRATSSGQQRRIFRQPELPKQMIRLRESLNGSFAVEAAETFEAQQERIKKQSPSRRRRGAARDGRAWRRSEVETLDLTG